VVSADDGLLKSLAAVAREQQAATVPAELGRPDPARQEQLVEVVVAATTARQAPPGPARQMTIPPRRRLGRWLAGLALPVAVAAGVAIWMRGTGPELPSYVASVTGGVSERRGAVPGGATLVLDAGTPVQVIVRPAVVTSAVVEARAFWVRQEQAEPQAQVWAGARIERSPTGSFLVSGPAERPFGPGPGSLVVVVAPAGELGAVIEPATLQHPPARWRVMRHPLVWR
jgi:hypothetical protein